jgi:hypothetical protein
MNEAERKLFVQLDDDNAPVRERALEALRARHKKTNSSFRGIAYEIEQAGKFAEVDRLNTQLTQQNAALDAELTQYKDAVGQWQAYSEKLKAERDAAAAAAGRRGRHGTKVRGKLAGARGRRGAWGLAACAAMPIAVLIGWHTVEHRPVGSQPRAADCVSGRVIPGVDGGFHWEPPHCGEPPVTRHMPRYRQRRHAVLRQPIDH